MNQVNKLIILFLLFSLILPNINANNIVNINKVGIYNIEPEKIYFLNLTGKYNIGFIGRSGDQIYYGRKLNKTILWRKMFSCNQPLRYITTDININKNIYIKGKGIIVIADYYIFGHMVNDFYENFPKGDHGVIMRYIFRPQSKYKITLLSNKESIEDIEIYYINFNSSSENNFIEKIKFKIKKLDYWETKWLSLQGELVYLQINLNEKSYIIFKVYEKNINYNRFSIIDIIFLLIIIIIIIVYIYNKKLGKEI